MINNRPAFRFAVNGYSRAILLPYLLVASAALSALQTTQNTMAQPVTVNHLCTRINKIPPYWIGEAKRNLHIAYGHTSHGSQLISGMDALVGFMNNLGYSADLFAFNSGGSGGALDLRDSPFDTAWDLGNPNRTEWAGATRRYLNAHPECNVIIWSWCGQADTPNPADITLYLNLMSQLERDYPGVQFVYMTGHLAGSGLNGDLHLRNQQIRNYCFANNKILYDFADIETYDPDGTWFGDKFPNDNCDYDSDGDGYQDRNWAIDWQNTHSQNLDWYYCDAAHSQPLNGNLKAYAAWWLWARLAGWNGAEPCVAAPSGLHATANSLTRQAQLNWQDNSITPGEIAFAVQRRAGNGSWATIQVLPANTTQFVDSGLEPGTYTYRVIARGQEVGGAACDSWPSNEASVVIAVATPAAPTDLQVRQSGWDLIVEWTDTSTDEDRFVLERRVDGGAFTVLAANLPPGTTSYTDPNPPAGHTYTYRVKANNTFGDSPYSSEAGWFSSPQTQTVRLEDTDVVTDTFLSSGSPNENLGETPYVSDSERYLVHFDLPAAVQGKRIIRANLRLYGWAQTSWAPNQYLDVYRLNRPWTADGATWNEARRSDPWTQPGGDYGSLVGRIELTAGVDHAFYPALDLSAEAQRWASIPEANLGLIVVNNSETRTGLKASEYGDGARSYLEIVYSQTSVESQRMTYLSCSPPQAPGEIGWGTGFDIASSASSPTLVRVYANGEAGCLQSADIPLPAWGSFHTSDLATLFPGITPAGIRSLDILAEGDAKHSVSGFLRALQMGQESNIDPVRLASTINASRVPPASEIVLPYTVSALGWETGIALRGNRNVYFIAENGNVYPLTGAFAPGPGVTRAFHIWELAGREAGQQIASGRFVAYHDATDPLRGVAAADPTIHGDYDCLEGFAIFYNFNAGYGMSEAVPMLRHGQAATWLGSPLSRLSAATEPYWNSAASADGFGLVNVSGQTGRVRVERYSSDGTLAETAFVPGPGGQALQLGPYQAGRFNLADLGFTGSQGSLRVALVDDGDTVIEGAVVGFSVEFDAAATGAAGATAATHASQGQYLLGAGAENSAAAGHVYSILNMTSIPGTVDFVVRLERGEISTTKSYEIAAFGLIQVDLSEITDGEAVRGSVEVRCAETPVAGFDTSYSRPASPERAMLTSRPLEVLNGGQ